MKREATSNQHRTRTWLKFQRTGSCGTATVKHRSFAVWTAVSKQTFTSRVSTAHFRVVSWAGAWRCRWLHEARARNCSVKENAQIVQLDMPFPNGNFCASDVHTNLGRLLR